MFPEYSVCGILFYLQIGNLVKYLANFIRMTDRNIDWVRRAEAVVPEDVLSVSQDELVVLEEQRAVSSLQVYKRMTHCLFGG